MPEIRINHDKIRDPQTITETMEREFKLRDMDIHQHEVTHLEDDHKRGVRKITVKNTKYFAMPQAPWKR